MSQQKPVVIRVRAKPNAREDRLTRDAEGHLVARVSERPVDGKANQAIQALVAKKLDVARRDVKIVGGERGRLKRVAISGASRELVQAAIARLTEENAATSPSGSMAVERGARG